MFNPISRSSATLSILLCRTILHCPTGISCDLLRPVFVSQMIRKRNLLFWFTCMIAIMMQRGYAAVARLQQRREVLASWVDAGFRAVPADTWLTDDTDFRLGGLSFQLRYVGPAHSPEDLLMYIKEDGVCLLATWCSEGAYPLSAMPIYWHG